jgi:hypothetical protein
MNWLQLFGAIGLGAILVKLLDIIWLQSVLQEHHRRNWLRDKRYEAFSSLSKEFISLGLHRPGHNTFEQFAIITDAMLLIEDDSLINRLDRFIVKLDHFNDLTDKTKPEDKEKSESLYYELNNEARLIIKELRSVLVQKPKPLYARIIPFKGKSLTGSCDKGRL